MLTIPSLSAINGLPGHSGTMCASCIGQKKNEWSKAFDLRFLRKLFRKLYNQHFPKFGMITFISKLGHDLINEVAESGTEWNRVATYCIRFIILSIIYLRKTTSFINLKGGWIFRCQLTSLMLAMEVGMSGVI